LKENQVVTQPVDNSVLQWEPPKNGDCNICWWFHGTSWTSAWGPSKAKLWRLL